ncbi:MAG: ectoine synthase [bacterium]
MIVRKLQEARQTSRCIDTEKWESVRLLLADDGMGFSFHITTIRPTFVNRMWYQNHLEAVFCLSGRGRLTEVKSGAEHTIEPGVIYALDKNDQHELVAFETLTLACVFNPPLRGKEVHNEDGAYTLDAEPIES